MKVTGFQTPVNKHKFSAIKRISSAEPLAGAVVTFTSVLSEYMRRALLEDGLGDLGFISKGQNAVWLYSVSRLCMNKGITDGGSVGIDFLPSLDGGHRPTALSGEAQCY